MDGVINRFSNGRTADLSFLLKVHDAVVIGSLAAESGGLRGGLLPVL